MPWVRRHHRRVPYGWGRTSVRSHYRRSPRGGVPVVAIVVAIVIILVLIALF
jgi:hypothetical protein